jgi:D-alanyl-D-alanine carboxypeptidase/D-alanyl-D-alanine-endopeptidase (penicillin-binding protein 4)
MAEPPQDETPPERRPGRTPAERAGATPLDPERFRANVGMPMVQRQREIPGQVPVEDEPVEPIVRRRPTRRRRTVSARPIWWAACVLGVIGLALIAVGWFTEGDVESASAPPPELVAATPVLSARRVPELVSRPVAVRNLRAAIDPVLARTPPASCLQVREGAVPLVSSNETAQVVPASNLKIVTGAAALALLDPQSRLTTRFVTDGDPTDGRVVRGNLYMIGGGDPLLSTDSYLNQLPNGRQPATQMEAVADQIVATGIREITGSVVGDDSRYDDVRIIDSWPERYLTQGQSGPLSALTVNDAWSATTGPGSDPPVHAAAVLTQLLEERGVTVAGEPTAGVAPEDAAPLTEVTSLTVAELVDEGLRFSDNTTMEMLVKEIGVQTSDTGSTEAGLAAIRTWIEESGLPAEGTEIVDGSGLSEQNRLTCRYVSALLEQQGTDGVVANGLARPGEPGTLDDRLLEADLQGRVRAKTGTLRPVTALSGWLQTVPERNLGFSYIINTTDRQVNEADEALQADLLESMLSYPDRPELTELSPGAPVAPGT